MCVLEERKFHDFEREGDRALERERIWWNQRNAEVVKTGFGVVVVFVDASVRVNPRFTVPIWHIKSGPPTTQYMNGVV